MMNISVCVFGPPIAYRNLWILCILTIAFLCDFMIYTHSWKSKRTQQRQQQHQQSFTHLQSGNYEFWESLLSHLPSYGK